MKIIYPADQSYPTEFVYKFWEQSQHSECKWEEEISCSVIYSPSLYGLRGLSKKKDKPVRNPEFAANSSEYFNV